MSDLKINLLGPPEILLAGELFETERRKALALLAYLAVTGRPQPREHLAAFFWPDYERDSAFSYLRRELYEINSALGKDWLQTDRRTAGLDLSRPIQIDTVRFETEIKASRTAEDPSPALQQAASLYRGDFLAGFFLQDTEPFEDWQREQTEHYRRAYAGVLERLAFLHEQKGAWDQAQHWAWSWLSLDDLNEAPHRALMRIYAGMGDRAAAVRQYETCRAELQEELGVEPQVETTALYERIVQDRFDRPGPPSARAPREDELPSNGQAHLPVMMTPFIGRRPEVEQVKELVLRSDNRLVTLFGPGGTGKTRLSIQAAAELGDHFEHGVWFVPLAMVEAMEDIVPAVAKALDYSFYREEEPPRQQLIDYLHQKNLLLILDNVEQLAGPESASLWMEILTGSEQVKLLATTRVRLNLPGEQLFVVSGMRLPDPVEAAGWTDPQSQAQPYSAVQLFLDRAERVQPDFRLSRENAAHVAEICRLVDGLPLGIELAAAWLELLPPEEIVEEIRRSMDFLETDQPNVPERQRSIRAVFDYSWRLLNEIEQEAFLKLCVFVGTFTSDAGRRVSGASLRTLLSLANKAWLQQAGDGRFQLHPLLLHYGQERLSGNVEVRTAAREAHSAYFVEWMVEAFERMRGVDQKAACEDIAREFNTNLRAVWNWLIEKQRWSVLTEKIAPGLYHFGEIRWRGQDLIEWFRAMRLAANPDADGLERKAYLIAGILEVHFEESWGVKENMPVERLQTCWRLVEEHDLSDELGFWYVLLANLVAARNVARDVDSLLEGSIQKLSEKGDLWSYAAAVMLRMNSWDGLQIERSEDEIRRALAIFREAGAVYEPAAIRSFIASNAFAANRPLDEVLALYEEAEQDYTQMNDLFGIGMLHWGRANLYFMRGIKDLGFREYREMRRIYTELGNQRMIGMSLSWESLWAVRYKSIEEAIEIRQRALSHARKYGVPSDVAWSIYELGDAYRISGDFLRAVELVREARWDFERLDFLLGFGYCERTLGDIAQAEGRYEAALQHYRAFHHFVEQDNHRWSSLQALGKIALVQAALGEVDAARRNLRSSLEQLMESSNQDLELVVLLAEVRCRMAEGRFEAAAALAAYVAENPMTWNEIRFQAEGFLEELSSKLPDSRIKTAAAQYRSRELRSLLFDLLEELSAGA